MKSTRLIILACSILAAPSAFPQQFSLPDDAAQRVQVPTGYVLIKPIEITGRSASVEWTGETETGISQISLGISADLDCKETKKGWKGALTIHNDRMSAEDLAIAPLTISDDLTGCHGFSTAITLLAVETVAKTELDKLEWEFDARTWRMHGRQIQLIRLKAAEQKAQAAACSLLYGAIADKKMSDLTVKEESAKKSCEAAGIRP